MVQVILSGHTLLSNIYMMDDYIHIKLYFGTPVEWLFYSQLK